MQFQQLPQFQQRHQFQNLTPKRIDQQRFNQPSRQDYSPMRKQSLNQPTTVCHRVSQQRFTPTRVVQAQQDYVQFQPRPPQRSPSPIQQQIQYSQIQSPLIQPLPPQQHKLQQNDFQMMKKAVTCFMQFNSPNLSDFDNMCVSLITAYLHEESKQKNFSPTCVMEIYESLSLLSKAVTRVMDSLREKINSIIKDDYLEDKGAFVSYKLAISDIKGFSKLTYLNTAPQSPVKPSIPNLKEFRPSIDQKLIETRKFSDSNIQDMKKTSHFNSNASEKPMDGRPQTPQSQAPDKYYDQDDEGQSKTMKKNPRRVSMQEEFQDNQDQ